MTLLSWKRTAAMVLSAIAKDIWNIGASSAALVLLVCKLQDGVRDARLSRTTQAACASMHPNARAPHAFRGDPKPVRKLPAACRVFGFSRKPNAQPSIEALTSRCLHCTPPCMRSEYLAVASTDLFQQSIKPSALACCGNSLNGLFANCPASGDKSGTRQGGITHIP